MSLQDIADRLTPEIVDRDRWARFVGQALELCHHASTEVEEGQSLRTTVVLALARPPDDACILRIPDEGELRESDPQNLVTTQARIAKLGLAALPDVTALWLTITAKGELSVLGIGTLPSRLRRTTCLIVHLLAPGVLRIESSIGHQVYRRGALEFMPQVSKDLSTGAGAWLKQSAKALDARARAEFGYSLETSNAATGNARHLALDFVAQVCALVSKMAHGGTLVLLKKDLPKKTGDRLFTRLERISDTRDWSRPLIECLAAASASRPRSRSTFINGRSFHAQAATASLEDGVERCARMTARLACVDGMLLLAPALDVLSFGAITSQVRPRTPKGQAAARNRGARHSSGLALAEQLPTGSVVAVISQDGGITISRREGKDLVVIPEPAAAAASPPQDVEPTPVPSASALNHAPQP